ncbi:MAG: hypothetical protein HYS13_14805 [Planctomycetia bacterium]|nr:hypothetical protein [Planctomycetia bacterium]
MSRPLGMQHSAAGRAAWRIGLLPVLLTAVALLILAAGVLSLARHLVDASPRPYRAAAAIVLVVVALVQLRVALACWKNRRALHLRAVQAGVFCEWLIVGAVLTYLVLLCLGPDPNLRYLYRAAGVVWYTALLLPLLNVQPNVALPHGRFSLRWTGHVLFFAAVLLVTAEGSTRVYSSLTDNRLPVTFVCRQHTLVPGSEFRGGRVNRLGYWGEEFQTAVPQGVFRVAVLGDETTLSGTSQTNFLVQVQERLPGVQIYNFGVPSAGPREYAALLTHDVLAYRPHLVLTCVSVGDDVTHSLPLPDWFDWQGLYVYQLGAQPAVRRGPASGFMSVAPQPAQADAFLRAAAARIDVCRSPWDDEMRRRWEDALSHLDDIVATCRASGVETALVVVPGRHQVEPQLCQTLCRRQGFSAGELDLELPQRQLGVFAQRRGVPMLDLLPHFRAATGPVYARNQLDWNDEGNGLAAEVIGRWLQRRLAAAIQGGEALTLR